MKQSILSIIITCIIAILGVSGNTGNNQNNMGQIETSVIISENISQENESTSSESQTGEELPSVSDETSSLSENITTSVVVTGPENTDQTTTFETTKVIITTEK